jgi:hypothetical protein
MSHNIARILWADSTVLRLILGGCALLFAFGLWFADSTGGAYNSMLRHAPASIWGSAFFIYGVSKFVLAFRPVSPYVVYCVVMLGVYLWLFTSLSFSDNPMRRMGSADVIIYLLVLCEIWVGAGTLARSEA